MLPGLNDAVYFLMNLIGPCKAVVSMVEVKLHTGSVRLVFGFIFEGTGCLGFTRGLIQMNAYSLFFLNSIFKFD